jgi:hypothetical protein
MSQTNYYINIFLTETYKSLGQYEIITNNNIIGELKSISLNNVSTLYDENNEQNVNTITITGLTSSRLEEVKSYDQNEPYKINVKGVKKVTNEFIEYVIDDVNYKTFLSDGLTIFSVIKETQIFEKKPVLWNGDSVFIDIKKTLNAMVIDRNNIPVYEYFNKINNCDNLDDVLDIF